MRLTREQIEVFAQSPRQVGVEEVADLCDDWIDLQSRLDMVEDFAAHLLVVLERRDPETARMIIKSLKPMEQPPMT